MNAQIWNAAVQFLSRRSHSKKELKIKLLRKRFFPDEIDEVLRNLESRGYICEEEQIRYRIEYWTKQGYGREWISQRLSRDGYFHVKEELYPPDIETLSQYLVKKSALMRRPWPALVRHLLRRGFSLRNIQWALQIQKDSLGSGN